jgi:uncharacterized HhH-GPD family protein
MISVTGRPDIDELLTHEPLALLIAMLLDQQVPLERAFSAPFDLKERLGGSLDAATIAAMDPDEFVAIFSAKPALHRFPAAMAERVQRLAQIVVDAYGGDAGEVWRSAPDGRALLNVIKTLPGFGLQKAQIFVALLAKQLGVRPSGWEQAAGVFGETGAFISVADIDSPESLLKVRAHKQAMKAAARAAAGEEPVKARKAPPKRSS